MLYLFEMKKILSIVLILTLILSICSCRRENVPSSAVSSLPSESPAPSSSATSSSVVPSVPEGEPVKKYETVIRGCYIYSAMETPDGKLLLNVNVNDTARNGYMIFDPADGSAGAVHLHREDQVLLGIRKNGNIITSDLTDNTVAEYDAFMNLVRKYHYSSRTYIYPEHSMDMEEEKIYSYMGSDLFITDLNTGTVKKKSFTGGSIVCMNMQKRLLCVSSPCADDIHDRSYMIYDMEKDVFRGQAFTDKTIFEFSGENLLATDDVYTDTVQDHMDYEIFEPVEAAYKGTFMLDRGKEIRCYDAGETVMLLHEAQEEEPKNAFKGMELGFLTEKSSTGTLIDVSFSQYAAMLLRDGSFIFMPMLDNGENGEYHIYSIIPSLTEKSDELRTYERTPSEIPEKHVAGDHLKGCRIYADIIERKFGVTVLIGNEVKNAHEPWDYSGESVEGVGEDKSNVSLETAEFLDELYKSLSRYPEGFFSNFRDQSGNGGIRFIVLRDILNKTSGSFEAGGLQYMYGSWYNIMIDLDSHGGSETIHHEIWHAVENLILEHDQMAFAFDKWQKMNPKKFHYSYDLDNYYDADVFGYLVYFTKEPYFARIYSTVSPMEDRATLIEMIFTEDEFYSEHGDFSSYYEMVLSSEHLRAKLDFMAQRTREVLGYVYWEEMIA